MRTTISINDSLLKKARQVALARSCSLGAVVEDALRLAFTTRPKAAAQAAKKPIVVFGGSGVRPGVDLNSSAALLEIMEGQ